MTPQKMTKILCLKKMDRLLKLLAKTNKKMMNKKARLNNKISSRITMTMNLSKSKRYLWSITEELAEEFIIHIKTYLLLKHRVFKGHKKVGLMRISSMRRELIVGWLEPVVSHPSGTLLLHQVHSLEFQALGVR